MLQQHPVFRHGFPLLFDFQKEWQVTIQSDRRLVRFNLFAKPFSERSKMIRYNWCRERSAIHLNTFFQQLAPIAGFALLTSAGWHGLLTFRTRNLTLLMAGFTQQAAIFCLLQQSIAPTRLTNSVIYTCATWAHTPIMSQP